MSTNENTVGVVSENHEVQHSSRAHAALNASSSHRWMMCPPSVRLSEQFADQPSVYAEEGTFLHELSELKLHRYNELAAGADVSTLKPDEIVAYVRKYLEGEGVDTTGLTPEALTATVMAYEEVSGGALTTSLTPDDITAMVVKYLEAEGVDISALKPDQIEALVSSFSEATGCDKSGLLTSLTGTVTEYKEASGVTLPPIDAKVAITGYDLIALQAFKKNNPVEVNGIVRLGEVFDDPSKAKEADNVKFYDGNGVEIPVTAVPTEMLTADKVAVLDGDGTMHVMITPQISGSQEAVEGMRETYQEVDQLGLTAIGKAVAASAGVYDTTLSGFVKAANQRIETAQGQLDHWWNFIMGGNSGILSVLDQSMQIDFNAENLSELSTYVGEVVAAIKNGEEVSVEDAQNLQDIVTLLQGLDTTGVGDNVKQGVAEGMTAGGWDADAETVAAALEAALNSAFAAHSPAQRMVPIGQNVSAGVGQGASQYDFSGDAGTIASALEGALTAAIGDGTFNSVGTTAMSGLSLAMSGYSFSGTGSTVAGSVQSAMSASLTTSTLRSIGVNAMAGLAAGIRAGTSSVTSAMRSAAQAAVRAAKSALVIRSPSHVFRDEVGIMTMRGFGEGILQESKAQAKTVRNAMRYLTKEAQEGAIVTGSTDNRKTYNNTSTVNLSVGNMNIRDQQDIQSLAIEIAALTKRRQVGKGLR